ncbi:hypothetical protein SMICM304S_04106 [Streptomyces microflavus]
MTELDRLTALFEALGADGDAPDWAESEAEEGLPQLARYRLLRTVWQDVNAWAAQAPRWVAAYRTDGVAAGAVDRALAAGLTPEDLGELPAADHRDRVGWGWVLSLGSFKYLMSWPARSR